MRTNPAKTDDALLATLEAAAEQAHMPSPLHVSDVMTNDVVSCHPTEMADRCAQIMWEQRCGCVPVVDEDNHPISLITDRDICMASWIQGKPISEIVVSSAMSKRLFIARADEELVIVEERMRHAGIRRVPVVNDRGELIGILSVDDILRCAPPVSPKPTDPFATSTLVSTITSVAHGR